VERPRTIERCKGFVFLPALGVDVGILLMRRIAVDLLRPA
jgi:hypothetical protein